MIINIRRALVASRLVNWDTKFQCAVMKYITIKVERYRRFQKALRKVAQIPVINRLIPYFLPLGLNIWRLIEYPKCIDFFGQEKGGIMLDIGSARTCFPSFLVKDGGTIICLDIDKELIRQSRIATRNLSKDIKGEITHIVADAQYLPFREASISKISAISTIEHIKSDEKAAAEIGRVLINGGICVMSFGFSLVKKNPTICEDGSLQRYYTNDEIYTKIVKPSNLKLEEETLFCKKITSFFYSYIPEGWFILKDLAIGLTLHYFENFFLKNNTQASAVILKLKKLLRIRA